MGAWHRALRKIAGTFCDENLNFCKNFKIF